MSDEIEIRPISERDSATILAMHKAAFGPGRFARTAYRIREGTPPVTPYCRAAFIGSSLVAALRFTPVTIGGTSGALLLGPVAVDLAYKGRGHGGTLIARSIADAGKAGIRLVLLVGDLPYYGRFGFKAVPPGQIKLSGPVNPARLLALELEDGALADYHGLVVAAALPSKMRP